MSTATARPQTSADFDRAIDKIRDEMAKSKGMEDNTRAVGEMMTALIHARPEWARCILTDGKTLKGAYAAMENYARSHKKGTCYGMGPETAQKVIFKYYGIEDGEPVGDLYALPAQAEAREIKAAEPTKPVADPFDLDALLGGL